MNSSNPQLGAGPVITGCEKEGASSMLNVEERINRLLDQLESSSLSQMEIDKIQSKIELLQDLKDS